MDSNVYDVSYSSISLSDFNVFLMQMIYLILINIVWRYHRGIQKLNKAGQTMQWSEEKRQTDKQWEIKHYTENNKQDF